MWKKRQRNTCHKDAQLRGTLAAPTENLNSIKKDMKTIKNNQSEMRDTLTEMNSNLQGITSTVDEADN